MDKINITNILERDNIINNIIEYINDIDNNILKNNIKKCIYIHGTSGCGKTFFIKEILNKLNYNIIEYTIFSIKNKITEFILDNKNKTASIINIFNKVTKKNIMLIDNIDTINNIDKTILTNLIKLIRPKKNKKQKDDENISYPIICIGDNIIDKKIKELIKISYTVKINSPTNLQIKKILENIIPDFTKQYNTDIVNNILQFINQDLRKLNQFKLLYDNNQVLDYFNKSNIYTNKNSNIKYITNTLINKQYNFNDDLLLINDTDKTTISLLYHENIIDYLNLKSNKENINLYLSILKNFCFCDYMDRIIFQKQIWQLNEISFKLKVIYNNNIFHNNIKNINSKLDNIRFTKILTKYSSEFNNYIFIINLSQQLEMDKKDLFLFFILIKNELYDKNILDNLNDIYEISTLDVNRIIKFLNNYINYEE
tara:strand:- start:4491 stop:5771 length:1281 start_codon:yes stop_codon:yes gene_type:complete